MATVEEHYAVALGLSNKIGIALQDRAEVPVQDILAFAQLHIELARLQLDIERPGRSLILPPNHR
jgi:hypothetical protein